MPNNHKKLKIGLLGYGKMGRLVAQLAEQKGHEIVATISRNNDGRNTQADRLSQVDVFIDFSQADQVLSHVQRCTELQKPLIIGTTGWEKDQIQVKALIEKASTGCLYSPNFSIGVHLFKQIVAYAAQLIQPLEEYDVSGIEYHHRQKQDAPSGTAKSLTEAILKEIPRLSQFQFASVRCGHIPGTHTICIDSPIDTITLTHEARSREGFAYGALAAAEWILNKKGFFTLEDMFTETE